MDKSIAEIAGKLTEADRACMIDLGATDKPWSMGNPDWRDYESRHRFYDLKLVEPRFPDAKPGDSGRQLWVFNETGLAIRKHLNGE